MAEYIRAQYSILRERIGEPRKFMQVLAGPRQVGKSTLVGQVLRNIAIPYSLENADGIDHEDTNWIRRVWESARIAMQLKHEEEHLLVIDEVQKIDNWSEAVKAEWDRDCREGRNLKAYTSPVSLTVTRL